MSEAYNPPSTPPAPSQGHVVATPPESHRKLLTLSYTATRLKESQKCPIELALQTRRDDAKMNKSIKIPEIPIEACLVNIHPCYRGPRLDGSYYIWLYTKIYDFNMPDIVRRINKFRGFPQRDDPEFNVTNHEQYAEYYASEGGQAEMEPYLPYLKCYWDTNGARWDEHMEILDRYHEDTDREEGRGGNVLLGHEDPHIMAARAEAVAALTTPPDLDSEYGFWEREEEDFDRDVARKPTPEKREYTPIATTAGDNSAEEQPVEDDREDGPSPGSLWLYSTSPPFPVPGSDISFSTPSRHSLSPNFSPATVESDAEHWNPAGVPPMSPPETPFVLSAQSPSLSVPGTSSVLGTPFVYDHRSPVFTPSPNADATFQEHTPRARQSSASSYHSPAGDLITVPPSAFPHGDPDWEVYRARTDVEFLARANGFEPTPWGARHSPVYDAEQTADPNVFGSLGLPMGIRRWHHYGPPPGESQPGRWNLFCACSKCCRCEFCGNKRQTPSPLQLQANTNSVRERVPTPHPFPEPERIAKREREEDADDELTPSNQTFAGRPTKKPRKQAAPRRKGGRKAKKRKAGDDDDSDYEFHGLEMAKEDEKYERGYQNKRTRRS
ncbi:hypothetical protein E8E14_003575 [Neopestalotiopsis sp. 37M]|nr:hypothetical protein E8E14_003575 [Neopestalotiopsis sp. 37M]